MAALADHGRNLPAARQAIREAIGENIMITRNENGDLVAEIAVSSSAMEQKPQMYVVAGAGFEPATFGL